MGSPIAAAFNREASVYDESFGQNKVGRLFRSVFQQRLLALLAPGSHVLDVGCGTGEDALFLASAGFTVHAIDLAAGMIERARAKAEERKIPEGRIVFECRAAEEIGSLTGAFDGACSDFGVLNCTDIAAVGRGLAQVLRPGAALMLSFMGRRPLPASIARVLAGRVSSRGTSRPRVGGVQIPVSYLSFRDVRDLMGPSFLWRGAFGLGVLIPGPDHAEWASRHPAAFNLLARLESLLRSWPGLRSLGDHLVLEGVRR